MHSPAALQAERRSQHVPVIVFHVNVEQQVNARQQVSEVESGCREEREGD